MLRTFRSSVLSVIRSRYCFTSKEEFAPLSIRLPFISLKVPDEKMSTSIEDVRIAASRKKDPSQLDILQTELQDLIDKLDVRLGTYGHAIGNIGDYHVTFKIDGKTIIRKYFDDEGYAEEVLGTLSDINDNKFCPKI